LVTLTDTDIMRLTITIKSARLNLNLAQGLGRDSELEGKGIWSRLELNPRDGLGTLGVALLGTRKGVTVGITGSENLNCLPFVLSVGVPQLLDVTTEGSALLAFVCPLEAGDQGLNNLFGSFLFEEVSVLSSGLLFEGINVVLETS
jgi:hypothetical protein